MSIQDVLDEVAAQVDVMRVDTAGQPIADGSGPRRVLLGMPAEYAARMLRAQNNARQVIGAWKWSGLLLERVVEAYAAGNRTDLRRAVVESAALAVAWLDAIDSRDDDDPAKAA